MSKGSTFVAFIILTSLLEKRAKITMQTPCFITLFIAISISQATSAYRFQFKNFGINGSDLFSFHGDAEYGPDAGRMSRSGALALTQFRIPFSHGRAIYINPITLKPPNNASSVYPFKTSFTFSITPHNTNPTPGHGFAFLVVPRNQDDAASGLGYLSLVNRTSNGNPNNHLFAVEFDVFQDKSLHDINDNHVGIDINSVDSVTSVKSGYWVMTRNGWLFKDLKLSSGDKYTAWVEYNNNLKVISVTIGLAHLRKPNRPLIEAKYDLSNVLLEKMYAGFAGSMGRGVETHEVWDWTFQN
ncbi:PREDICTED: lectin-like protein At1g53070 [Brassica oleracea var. oleracea]|uniref:lectin-like protein At1g53070 n=1 Tax=Brassica oleracea var. oleracea TaxID=109376 RepID=UPI0006A6F8BC|nr:PREDICTED: lectin-like protein At1g53070 [Brassica oleracea var. oleracea]